MEVEKDFSHNVNLQKNNKMFNYYFMMILCLKCDIAQAKLAEFLETVHKSIQHYNYVYLQFKPKKANNKKKDDRPYQPEILIKVNTLDDEDNV